VAALVAEQNSADHSGALLRFVPSEPQRPSVARSLTPAQARRRTSNKKKMPGVSILADLVRRAGRNHPIYHKET
jgi:hypothetical protein